MHYKRIEWRRWKGLPYPHITLWSYQYKDLKRAKRKAMHLMILLVLLAVGYHSWTTYKTKNTPWVVWIEAHSAVFISPGETENDATYAPEMALCNHEKAHEPLVKVMQESLLGYKKTPQKPMIDIFQEQITDDIQMITMNAPQRLRVLCVRDKANLETWEMIPTTQKIDYWVLHDGHVPEGIPSIILPNKGIIYSRPYATTKRVKEISIDNKIPLIEMTKIKGVALQFIDGSWRLTVRSRSSQMRYNVH